MIEGDAFAVDLVPLVQIIARQNVGLRPPRDFAVVGLSGEVLKNLNPPTKAIRCVCTYFCQSNYASNHSVAILAQVFSLNTCTEILFLPRQPLHAPIHKGAQKYDQHL